MENENEEQVEKQTEEPKQTKAKYPWTIDIDMGF